MKLYLFFFLFITSTSVQQSGIWGTLAMVSVKKQFDPNFGMEIDKITVSPAVLAMQGKEIEVDGYIIPLTGKLEQNHIMLSKFPENMCFFCGKAGPESAMQVFLAKGKKVAYTDKKVKFKGILLINNNNDGSLLYTLDQAEVLK